MAHTPDAALSNDGELVPELNDWNVGKGIGLADWITCVGNFEHALGYSALFWPRFCEHDGCVFCADGFTVDNYNTWLDGGRRDRKAVQSVMNHVHIVDLFPNVTSDPTRAQVVRLGRVLREMFSAKLAQDFPSKKVEVHFYEEDCEDLLDYQLTFFAVDPV
jgi:hypothetical protein